MTTRNAIDSIHNTNKLALAIEKLPRYSLMYVFVGVCIVFLSLLCVFKALVLTILAQSHSCSRLQVFCLSSLVVRVVVHVHKFELLHTIMVTGHPATALSLQTPT